MHNSDNNKDLGIGVPGSAGASSGHPRPSRESARPAAKWLHLAILTAVALWIVFFPFFRNPARHGDITGDSIQYYAYLQSIFEDGDIQFLDDYLELYPRDQLPDRNYLHLPTGFAANSFAPGAPLSWAPFYLCGKLYVALAGSADRPAELRTLITFTRLGSRVYTALSIFLFFFILRMLFSPNIALLGALAAFFCTSFYAYGLLFTLYSHNVAAFAVALFVWYLLRSGPQRSPKQWLLLGIIGGYVALCRWQDAVILIWPAIEQAPILFRAVRERVNPGRLLARYAAFISAFLVTFSPQLILWWIIFGPFKTPLSYNLNAAYWDRPEFLNLLFSSRNGLLSWHPLVYLSLIGLVLLIREKKIPAIAALSGFALLLYLNAVTGDWWAGDSFGMRRFISYSALFAIGIGAFAVSLKRWFGKWPQIAPVALVLVFAWWNFGALELYQSGGVSHDKPPTFAALASGQLRAQIISYGYPFTWPGSLIHALMIGGGSPDEADWIVSTYLFGRHENLDGRISADTPFFRGGFSGVKSGKPPFRLIEGDSAVLFVSRLENRYDFIAMIIDGALREGAIERDEVALVEVLVNGGQVGVLTGDTRILRRWEPLNIGQKFWQRGLNRIDLRLYTGKRDKLGDYTREGGSRPLSDASIRANHGAFSIRINEIRFFRGKISAKRIRQLYRDELGRQADAGEKEH